MLRSRGTWTKVDGMDGNGWRLPGRSPGLRLAGRATVRPSLCYLRRPLSSDRGRFGSRGGVPRPRQVSIARGRSDLNDKSLELGQKHFSAVTTCCDCQEGALLFVNLI